MEYLSVITKVFEKNPFLIVLVILLAFVGIIGQWSLYTKCDQKGIASVVPVWNVIAFLKIVGRPSSHSILVMAPPPVALILFFLPLPSIVQIGGAALIMLAWAFLMAKIYIEVCQSFNKYDTTSYVLCILFNGFYVLNLGLSDAKYRGPVYGRDVKPLVRVKKKKVTKK